MDKYALLSPKWNIHIFWFFEQVSIWLLTHFWSASCWRTPQQYRWLQTEHISNGNTASHARKKKNIIPSSVQSLICYGCGGGGGGGGSGGVWVGCEDEGVISYILKLNPRDSFFVFSCEVVAVGREGWQQAARRVVVAPGSEPGEARVSNGHHPRQPQCRIPAPSALYVTISHAGTETYAYPPGTSDHSCFLGIL